MSSKKGKTIKGILRSWIGKSSRSPLSDLDDAFDMTFDDAIKKEENEWRADEEDSNPNCCNSIDDRLRGLYSLPSEDFRPLVTKDENLFEYDWLVESNPNLIVEEDEWGEFHSASIIENVEDRQVVKKLNSTPKHDSMYGVIYFNYLENMPDMSTAEGRFIRRLFDSFVEEDEEQGWEYFCNEDVDYVLEVLNNAEDDEKDENLLINALSKVSTVLHFVEKMNARLSTLNFEEILTYREVQQDVELEVAKASLYLKSAQESLKGSKSFVDEELVILDTLESRQKHHLLQDKLILIKEILEQEKKFKCCQLENVQEFFYQASKLKQDVKLFQSLKCFQNITERLGVMYKTLCNDLFNKLKTCICKTRCHKMSNEQLQEEFIRIIEARILLQPFLEEEIDSFAEKEEFSIIESIASCIISCMTLEMERGLANSIFCRFSNDLLNSNDMGLYQMQILNSNDKISLRNISTALLVTQYHLWEDSVHDIFLEFEKIILKLLSIQVNLEKYCSSCSDSSYFSSIETKLHQSRNQIWSQCRSCLVFFLEQYIYIYKHVNNQSTCEWRNELNRISIIYNISKTLCENVGYKFCDVDEKEVEEVSKKLRDLLKKYIRGIHVEAMNSMGSLLFHEEWNIVEMQINEDNPNMDSFFPTINGIQKVIRQLLIDFSTFDDSNEEFFNLCSKDECENYIKYDLYSMLRKFTEKDEANKTFKMFIASNSSINGLVKWTSRLCKVIEILCPGSDAKVFTLGDINFIFSDVYDLFFLTIFRLCAKNASYENVLLETLTNDDLILNGNCSLKKNTFSNKHVLSPTVEADICAPVPDEYQKITLLRKFIQRGQDAIGSFVQLDKVERWILDVEEAHEIKSLREISRAIRKRFVAATSCLFAAAVLDVAYSFIENLELEVSCLSQAEFKKKISLKEYTNILVEISPTFASIAFQAASVRAIGGRRIIREVLSIGQGWENMTLDNHSNDYVELLADGCALLLESMQNDTTTSLLPNTFISFIWSCIVGSSYLSLLHGFSLVANCSMEGRALMSMDLATFSNALPKFNYVRSFNEPLNILPQRNMLYVDAYIKAYYYNQEDVLKWLAKNCGKYHFNHSLALISCSVSARSSNNFEHLKDKVRDLYRNKLGLSES